MNSKKKRPHTAADQMKPIEQTKRGKTESESETCPNDEGNNAAVAASSKTTQQPVEYCAASTAASTAICSDSSDNEYGDSDSEYEYEYTEDDVETSAVASASTSTSYPNLDLRAVKYDNFAAFPTSIAPQLATHGPCPNGCGLECHVPIIDCRMVHDWLNRRRRLFTVPPSALQRCVDAVIDEVRDTLQNEPRELAAERCRREHWRGLRKPAPPVENDGDGSDVDFSGSDDDGIGDERGDRGMFVMRRMMRRAGFDAHRLRARRRRELAFFHLGDAGPPRRRDPPNGTDESVAAQLADIEGVARGSLSTNEADGSKEESRAKDPPSTTTNEGEGEGETKPVARMEDGEGVARGSRSTNEADNSKQGSSVKDPPPTLTKEGEGEEEIKPSIHQCMICFDEFPPPVEMPSLGCNHSYCGDCWHGYITAMFDGAPQNAAPVTCPQQHCRRIVGEEFIENVAPASLPKFRELQLQAFIQANSETVRWCPGPNCARAAFIPHAELFEDTGVDFYCDHCDTAFCFGCGLPPHDGDCRRDDDGATGEAMGEEETREKENGDEGGGGGEEDDRKPAARPTTQPTTHTSSPDPNEDNVNSMICSFVSSNDNDDSGGVHRENLDQEDDRKPPAMMTVSATGVNSHKKNDSKDSTTLSSEGKEKAAEGKPDIDMKDSGEDGDMGLDFAAVAVPQPPQPDVDEIRAIDRQLFTKSDDRKRKKCPKCEVLIEKMGGCNRMSCKCGHFFCWLCLADYPVYGGHFCGRPNQDPGGRRGVHLAIRERAVMPLIRVDLSFLLRALGDADCNDRDAQQTLERIEDLHRYAHFYNRYHAHGQGQNFATTRDPCLSDSVEKYISTAGLQSGNDSEFVREANTTLVVSRRILKFSYCAVHNDDQESSHLGHDHLERLERFTEELSGRSEAAQTRQDRLRVVDLIAVVSKCMEAVVEYEWFKPGSSY